MIIKNNTPKKRTLYYKVNGVISHITIDAYSQSRDIEEITHIDQLQLSTYERRLRHIETYLGKSFTNPFSVPGDSEFSKFRLTASVTGNYSGTILPTSSSVSEGENITFTLVLPASSRTIVVTEQSPTLGTITPTGNVVVTSVPSLSTLVDNGVSKMGSLVYVASGTSAYTITNVSTAHTLSASFDVVTTARTFSMSSVNVNLTIDTSVVGTGSISSSGSSTATTATYLKTLNFNNGSFLNSVTGTLSGSSSCSISGVTAYTNTLTTEFANVATAKTFSMEASIVNIPITASASGGTISTASGSTSATTATNLSAFTFNGVSFLNSVIGTLSGSSSCIVSGITATTNTVSASYGYIPTAVTITMSASTNEETPLRSFTVNGTSKIGDVTGAVSGESFYSLVMTNITPQVVVATFFSGV